VGLTDALSEALAPTRERPSVHDPGEVVRDLCVMLADGGDCLAVGWPRLADAPTRRALSGGRCPAALEGAVLSVPPWDN